MTLAPGSRLGAYEIVVPLGAGGMGEVYRARDTRLKREVAIKVLPEAFAADPERLARFQREAEVIASLNHPNIAAIHGLEESSGTRALVLELVEGPTLAEQIARGPIPIDEALPIARQITEALEAAHERGIIHRDLKPANIKIASDGAVKVLDFGLAKALEPNVASATADALSQSPTITSPALVTGGGVLLGTAAYMSPEQAKGRAADKRSDIWAFGCVLFEMLTGKRAFAGDDVSETLASVLAREPDWSALPKNTPHTICVLLRRCLERDRTRRLDSAGAARLEIADAFTTSGSGAVPLSPTRIGPNRTPWIVASSALLVASALAVPAVMHFREPPPAAPPELRTQIVTPPTTDPISLALSPDGRQIVFVATDAALSRRLWVRPLNATEAEPISGTDGASLPFWSPDSRSIGFFANGQLKRADLAGGAPRTLTVAATPRGGAWGVDGTILFAGSPTTPLLRIPATGGAAVAVTKVLDGQEGHRFPQFLPDGRRFVYYAAAADGTAGGAGIYLSSLDAPSNATRLVGDDAIAPAYAAGDWLLFVRGGALSAQRLDVARGVLIGDPVTVAEGVVFGAGGRAAYSVSDAGLIAYRSGEAERRQLTWFDRAGRTLGTLGAPDSESLSQPVLSPDSQRVAVGRSPGDNTDLWLLDAARATRFTFEVGGDRFPVWSPDGRRLVFASDREKSFGLYMKQSDLSGGEERLLASAQQMLASDWSLDGRFLAYFVRTSDAANDIWILPMDGDRTPFPFLKTRFDERAGVFSPDGRWLAYFTNESGKYEVSVRAFTGTPSGTAGQWQVSTGGGTSPQWRSDGRELYYLAPDSTLMAVSIAPSGNAIAPDIPMPLFRTGIRQELAGQYDVSRDGRFLINTSLDDATAPITLLQHWNPETARSR